MATYARDPDALAALKRIVLPNGDEVSSNVAENDPEINMPTPTSMSEIEGNNRVKQMLGLGPSPMIQRQGQDLAKEESAISQARTAAQPDVAAQADQAYKEKLALAGEPNRVAGQSSLALQTNQQQATRDLIDSMGGSGPEQPGKMRMSINAKGEPTFAPPTAEPAQVMAQQHAAAVGLGGISALRNIVQTLDRHGAIGPTAGRLGELATSTGLDSYLPASLMSPEAAQAFNDFKAQASLVKSNMAMAHGGARGGSSPQLAARFDALINPHQSAAALKGSMDAFERWLTAYANAKNSSELDAADAALGVGNEPATGADVSQNYVSTDPNRGR